MTKLKKWELSLMLALCLTLCLGTWATAQQSAISGGLVRLHVLAASDDKAEQELKLRVRDAVLTYISPYLKNAQSAADAKRIIGKNLDGIKSAAETAAEGRQVTVSLSEEYYPTREYGTFTLPAGRYDSLRVILGDGAGHNWWCVVFPPLCVSAAGQEAALNTMSEDTRGLVTEAEGYKLKFRIVELWEELVELIN